MPAAGGPVDPRTGAASTASAASASYAQSELFSGDSLGRGGGEGGGEDGEDGGGLGTSYTSDYRTGDDWFATGTTTSGGMVCAIAAPLKTLEDVFWVLLSTPRLLRALADPCACVNCASIACQLGAAC